MLKGGFIIKDEEKSDVSKSFGIGVFLVVFGLLMAFLHEGLIVMIIGCVIFSFGFFGIGFELEKLGLRSPYILVSGFPFLIIAFIARENFWFFTIFMSAASAIFFTALVETILNYTQGKINNVLKVEGLLSVIGSLSSTISLIFVFLPV